jgi:uncharacterized YigZ family protein
MNRLHYRIPAKTNRVETTVSDSRFIVTAVCADSVDAAKKVLADIRAEMHDASHHVYAYRIGYGNSVTEGMSDDGEPSGTAGPPVLSVLRGAAVGDILVVVTRYFGGTKLGTGGLVRAYGDAARTVLQTLETEEKIPRQVIGIEISYSLYEPIKRLISQHNGILEDETFAGLVTLIARFPVDNLDAFTSDLSDATAGRVQPIILSED